ncbi:MAG: hypothetical protein V4519_00405 [Patescibacteria group bacterium]
MSERRDFFGTAYVDSDRDVFGYEEVDFENQDVQPEGHHKKERTEKRKINHPHSSHRTMDGITARKTRSKKSHTVIEQAIEPIVTEKLLFKKQQFPKPALEIASTQKGPSLTERIEALRTQLDPVLNTDSDFHIFKENDFVGNTPESIAAEVVSISETIHALEAERALLEQKFLALPAYETARVAAYKAKIETIIKQRDSQVRLKDTLVEKLEALKSHESSSTLDQKVDELFVGEKAEEGNNGEHMPLPEARGSSTAPVFQQIEVPPKTSILRTILRGFLSKKAFEIIKRDPTHPKNKKNANNKPLE